MQRRRATATESSSCSEHEQGTEGLPQRSEQDEEEEEDEDEEQETQESAPRNDFEAGEEMDSASEDDSEEMGEGGFPGDLFKKRNKSSPKSPISTASTNSRARGSWEQLQRFDNTGNHDKTMKKVANCFVGQMCLAGSCYLESTPDYQTLAGWKRNKVAFWLHAYLHDLFTLILFV